MSATNIDDLRMKISHSEEARRVSIQQVALAAGVSAATVSRVLNSPEAVGPELVERVRKVVQELGYRPDRAARRLRARNNIQRVGFLVDDIQNPHFTAVFKGVEQRLMADHIALIVGDSNDDPDYEMLNIELMREEQVNGVIVNFASSNPRNYTALAGSGLHIVCFNHVPSGLPFDSVVPNDYEAVQQAVRHLLALGHRRFGMVSGPEGHASVEGRQRGFVDALYAAGLEDGAFLIERGDWKMAGAWAAANRLLDRATLPIALLTVSNDTTTATLRAIRQRKLSIPGQVALIGFDELSWADAYQPPLTVIDQHPFHLGAVAADLLLARMQHPDRPKQQVVMDSTLVVRESCGAGSAGP